MCGLVGIVNRNGQPVASTLLAAMTDALAHRGPDGEGLWLGRAVGLGHRRLSVYDATPAAAQPMARVDAPGVLAYVGEVFNDVELRAALQEAGVRFRSHGDTEVVFQALRAWGERALALFEGMFALAWVDETRGVVTLARDVLGIKPLYYAELGGTVVFASEVKAILRHPQYRPAPDPEALAQYLAFQNVFSHATLFAGIRQLAPGCVLRIPLAAEGAVEVRRYRGLDHNGTECRRPFEDSVAEADDLLRRAVLRHMRGDEQPSAYLSGGVDSALVSAFAAGATKGLRTISIGFDVEGADSLEVGADESEAAAELARQLKTDHYARTIDARCAQEALAPVIWHLEDPRMGQSYANYRAAEVAAAHGRTVLSGLGGDELFGGYPWRYAGLSAGLDEAGFRDRAHGYWHGVMSEEERRALLAPIWNAVAHVDTREVVSEVIRRNPIDAGRPFAAFRRWRAFEMETFLPGLLGVEDKLGMAHGMETRFPLLDGAIISFALGLPVDHLVPTSADGGIATLGANQGKRVLRQVLRRRVPARLAERPKRGFTGPDNSWYRAEKGAYVRLQLSDPREPVYRLVDHAAAWRMLDRHLGGEGRFHRLIWSLLSLNQWCKMFL